MLELRVKITKWTAAKTIIVAVMLVGAFFFGATSTVPTAYRKGLQEGYVKALADVKELLGEKGIAFSWEDVGDGKYLLSVSLNGQLLARAIAEVHLNIQHYRNGALLSDEWGAGVLTNIGKDWIEQQLGASDGTQEALYEADSNDATEPLATWTILPTEITTNGLDRQTGVYSSLGVGNWKVEVTKAVTGTQSTQLWGLHWIVTDNSDNNLLAADSGPAQKNCVNGDTLKETWTVTVS